MPSGSSAAHDVTPRPRCQRVRHPRRRMVFSIHGPARGDDPFGRILHYGIEVVYCVSHFHYGMVIKRPRRGFAVAGEERNSHAVNLPAGPGLCEVKRQGNSPPA